MTSKKCPRRDLLTNYALGKLLEEDMGTIASHLDACQNCQAELDTMELDRDTLVLAVRRSRECNSQADNEFENEPALRDTLTLIKAIGRNPSFSSASGAVASASSAAAEEGDLGAIRNYRLLARLGKGGMGAVYKALHTQLEKVVALKVLPAERMNPAAVARFQREMRAVGKLAHPNIVQAFDAGEHAGTHFLVMECIAGKDLSALVRHHGPLPVADACEIIRQVAVGLQYAHERGLVHRDIKPANLMLAMENGCATVKILDLGLALLQEPQHSDGELTAASQMMGTADYIAPEQTGNSHGVDIRADIYSLGCTLYKLLTGSAPYDGPEFKTPLQKMMGHLGSLFPDIRLKRSGLPTELVALLGRMVAKRPDDRFPTPAHLVQSIAPFCQGHNLARLHISPSSQDAKKAEPELSAMISTHGVPSASLLETQDHVKLPQFTLNPSPSRRQNRRPLLIALASLAAFCIALAAIVVRIQTRDGTLVLTVDGPQANVTVDGKIAQVTLGDDGKTYRIAVEPGTHKLRVSTPDGGEFMTPEQFRIVAGQETLLTAVLEPTSPREARPRADASRAAPLRKPPAVTRQPIFLSGTWSREGDVLQQTSADTPALLIFGKLGWTDGDFTGEVWHVGKGIAPTLVVRALDETRYTYMEFGGYGNAWIDAHAVQPGHWERIRIQPLQMPVQQWVGVKVQLRGATIKAFVNGHEVLQGEDPKRMAGAIGLRTFGGPAKYRNLRFTDPDGNVLWEGLPELSEAAPSKKR